MKFRVAILTSIACGTASRVLPSLLQSDKLEVTGAVLIQASPRQRFRIKPKKIREIGLLGALNGLRLRRWYRDHEAADLRTLCAQAGITCIETDSTNGQQTRDALENFHAHLGLSLGNSYIRPAIYEIPQYGMINVHGEILPAFKGAQSVIWPIYEGKTISGLTVHQVAKSIDGGDILHRVEVPIVFGQNLRATVEQTTEITRSAVPEAVRFVCENYLELRSRSQKQTGGKRYTTPTFPQFLRMIAKHRQLRLTTGAARSSA